jgi:hypothetical protein
MASPFVLDPNPSMGKMRDRSVNSGYRVVDLSQLFGVSRSRVYGWFRRGLLVHDGSTRAFRVQEENVARFIRAYPREYDIGRVNQKWCKAMIFDVYPCPTTPKCLTTAWARIIEMRAERHGVKGHFAPQSIALLGADNAEPLDLPRIRRILADRDRRRARPKVCCISKEEGGA